MTVRQLRPFREPEDEERFYAERYPSGYDHTVWPDHRIRVQATIGIAARWVEERRVRVIADLSCGNAAIVHGLMLAVDTLDQAILGDVVPQSFLDYEGRIENTLDEITDDDDVGMFVLSETLEHVREPQLLLGRIRRRSRMLVLTTPTENWDDENPEHYWAWNTEDVGDMLIRAGWRRLETRVLDTGVPGAYLYQIWVCE